MSLVEANYTKEKSIRHGFLNGLAPWMSKNNTSGTVTTETANGGRAVLSTGTGAADDRARIDIGPVTPDPGKGIDAVGLRCVFAFDPSGASAGNAAAQFGFLNADIPNRIYHQPNHTSGDDSTVRVSSGSNDITIPTRQARPTTPIETELLWDTVEPAIYHRYQNSFAVRVTENDATLPDPTIDHTIKLQMATKNTSSDRQMYLYDVELAYYARRGQ